MKKYKIGVAILAIVLLGLGLNAWRDTPSLTPAQETAIYSLANRYLKVFCRSPGDLAEIFESSVIPYSLIRKSKDYLQELIYSEGECYGNSIADMQKDLLREIRYMPENLIENNLITFYGVSDFANCLVEVEKSFYNLHQASRRVLDCVDKHIDLRGIWAHLVRQEAETYIEDDSTGNWPPTSEPIIYPPAPPVPICYDTNCLAGCQDAQNSGREPMSFEECSEMCRTECGQ